MASKRSAKGSSPRSEANVTGAGGAQRREVDLHFHSTYSDGVETVAALAKKAISRNLKAVSLTDHDTVAGVGELRAVLRGSDVAVISGTELSCQCESRELHLLGYGVDCQCQELLKALALFQEKRKERFKKMVDNLRTLGVSVDYEKICRDVGSAVLGRPHLTKALIEGCFCRNRDEVYQRYIGDHGPAYEKKYFFPIREAASLIHRAGGVAVMAHPGLYGFKREFILECVGAGVDGIEVIHPKHSEEQMRGYEAIVLEKKLVMTGGSDYHGDGVAGVECEVGACGASELILESFRNAKNGEKITWR